ncbi:hypothetical protein AX17_000989 [Amanita inopinata Kibby_2008]|nr:hypothetical protein AX17_000989 [Amanita inopinata Kibby_2008]
MSIHLSHHHHERLFKPVLTNPLHTSAVYNDSFSEKQLPMLSQVSSSCMSKKSILKPHQFSSHSKNLHVRWSEPLCQIETFLTQEQDESMLDAMDTLDDFESSIQMVDETSSTSYSIPPSSIPLTWNPAPEPHPALYQGKQQAFAPVVFKTTVHQQKNSQAEEMTRVNLLPLMLKQGITLHVLPRQPTAPRFIPTDSPHLSQHGYLHKASLVDTPFSSAPYEVNIHLTISPCATQEMTHGAAMHDPSPIGKSCDLDYIYHHLDQFEDGKAHFNAQPSCAAPGHKQDVNQSSFSNASQPSHISPTRHTKPLSKHTAKASAPKRHPIPVYPIPQPPPRFHPAHKSFAPLDTIRILKWANDLRRLWYLLEQGKYDESDHKQLISLLKVINEHKLHPNLTLSSLAETKLVDILKKFRDQSNLSEYDPRVRQAIKGIIGCWKAKWRQTSS